MNEKTAIHVLRELGYFPRFMPESRIRESVLDYCKQKRKGLTKEEILEKGLNIFEKRETSIDKLIAELTAEGLIQRDNANKHDIRLSEKGLACLMDIYTEHYSPSYLQFEKEISDLAEKWEEPNFQKLHVASLFYNQRSIVEVESMYFIQKSSVKEKSEKTHLDALTLRGYTASSGQYVLHLLPRLFLSVEDMNEKVELSIEGIDVPNSFVLGKPYPNKRYVVGGIKEGKKKKFLDFYPIIASKEEFPKEKVIIFHWKLGNGKEYIHQIHLTFHMDKGFLFSTNQSLNRSSDVPYINVTTITEPLERLSKNKDIKFEEEENRLYIKERVMLTSVPFHLHSNY